MESVQMEKESLNKGYDEYDCRRFAETLIEAKEIEADEKKMDAAQKHIKKLKKDISSLDDLKRVRKEKLEESEES